MFGTERNGDTIPPTVVSTDPANGTKDVHVDSMMSITFSEPMNTSFTESAIIFLPYILNLTATWDATNTTLYLSGKLEEGKSYVVTISTEAGDKAGNKMVAPYSFEFRTKSGVGQPSGPTTTGPNWGDLMFTLPLVIIVIVVVVVIAALFALKKRGRRPVEAPPPPQLTFQREAHKEERKPHTEKAEAPPPGKQVDSNK
jgi:hypothetical protein